VPNRGALSAWQPSASIQIWKSSVLTPDVTIAGMALPATKRPKKMSKAE
jgi:hypothetical protein